MHLIILAAVRKGYKLGMCNSDRVLEYSAVTVMIDHENDDHGKIHFWLVIAALWSTYSLVAGTPSLCLQTLRNDASAILEFPTKTYPYHSN